MVSEKNSDPLGRLIFWTAVVLIALAILAPRARANDGGLIFLAPRIRAAVAPPPRPVPKKDVDLRCRARAAFAFEAAKLQPPMKVSDLDRAAAKRAFDEAARTLAASKTPVTRP